MCRVEVWTGHAAGRDTKSFPFPSFRASLEPGEDLWKAPCSGDLAGEGASCQLIRLPDSGKRRPPWPAVPPAESADAMVWAGGPAPLAPSLGCLSQDGEARRPGGGSPRAGGRLFSLVKGLPLHAQRVARGICRSEMGELVPNFFFIRFCFMLRNKDE